MTGIVIDLAPHPHVHYAVIVEGELLPIRFSRREEAGAHLGAIVSKRAMDQAAKADGVAA